MTPTTLSPFWNIPLALTYARLMCTPILCGLLTLPHPPVRLLLVLVLVLSLTDFFDGYLARKWQQTSALGAILDPLADKLMIAGAMGCLWYKGCIPSTLLIGIYVRDALILGGVGILKYTGTTVKITPLWSSKLHTTLECLYLLALLSYAFYFGFWPGTPIHTCVFCATYSTTPALWRLLIDGLVYGLWVTLLWSGAGYGYKGWSLWRARIKKHLSGAPL